MVLLLETKQTKKQLRTVMKGIKQNVFSHTRPWDAWLVGSVLLAANLSYTGVCRYPGLILSMGTSVLSFWVRRGKNGLFQ